MNEQREGWVLIQRETDEYYGIVQWRDENGIMTNKREPVELNWPKADKYIFCNAGLGELKIAK